jgi:hypothetical protein
LTVWKVPRQCPLVLLVRDLFNFGLKDVGAAVVGSSCLREERERERESWGGSERLPFGGGCNLNIIWQFGRFPGRAR